MGSIYGTEGDDLSSGDAYEYTTIYGFSGSDTINGGGIADFMIRLGGLHGLASGDFVI